MRKTANFNQKCTFSVPLHIFVGVSWDYGLDELAMQLQSAPRNSSIRKKIGWMWGEK